MIVHVTPGTGVTKMIWVCVGAGVGAAGAGVGFVPPFTGVGVGLEGVGDGAGDSVVAVVDEVFVDGATPLPLP